jgi:excisionase family DNA binding protein
MDQTGTLGSLLTVPAACRAYGLGRRQLQRAIRGGALSVYDVGGWPRVSRAELARWVEAQRRGGPRQPDPDPMRPGVASPEDRLRYVLGRIEAQADRVLEALRRDDGPAAERALRSILDLIADQLQRGDS